MTVSDVWMTPTPFKESRLWRLSSSAVLLLVSVCSKVIFGLNKPSVYRKEAFNRCVAKRPQSKPLITVSNHYSMIDDFLVSYMLPWKQLRNRPSIRWLPGAKDVCCRTKPTSLFFQLGRVIPVVRGDGVYQHGMDFCASRLDEGEWVHIYPEGKVNTTKDFMRLKWGVGRLIADSKVSPLVLPYWHLGMENMFPTKKPYYPRVGNEEVRKYVTDKIQEVFAKLKSETETRHKGFCATIDT